MFWSSSIELTIIEKSDTWQTYAAIVKLLFYTNLHSEKLDPDNIESTADRRKPLISPFKVPVLSDQLIPGI